MSDWKHISEVAKETKEYIDKRRKGEIKSLKTGFTKLDEANLGGIEWRSAITIGGRPSAGKTIFSSCILRSIFKNNDISDIVLLDFNWEMASRTLLIRELAANSSTTYKNVISAGDIKVSDEAMLYYERLLTEYAKNPVWYMEEPKTAKEFADCIRRKRDQLKDKKLIIRIDHSILAKQSSSEANQVQMLHNLMSEGNLIKRQSDVVFIYLTQLGRDMEDRQENGTDKAFPRQMDVYGSDATAQFSEAMILLNRPSMYNITYYGNRNSSGMEINKEDLFAHIVKNRNAEPNLIIRYETDFAKMSIKEL